MPKKEKGKLDDIENQEVIFNLPYREKRNYVHSSDLLEYLIKLWPDENLRIKFIRPISYKSKISTAKPAQYEGLIKRQNRNGHMIFYISKLKQEGRLKRISDDKISYIVIKIKNYFIFLYLQPTDLGEKIRAFFDWYQKSARQKYLIKSMKIEHVYQKFFLYFSSIFLIKISQNNQGDEIQCTIIQALNRKIELYATKRN